MSAEAFTPNLEQPFSPEYWDGHNFGDECAGVDPATRQPFDQGILDRLKRHRSRTKAEKEAIKKTEDQIGAYYVLSKGGAVPLATFGRREAFDPRTQRVGTIFRENFEITWNDLTEKINFDTGALHGVVYEAQGVGVRAARWILGPGAYCFFKHSDEPIEIGLVQHRKTPSLIPDFDFESILRVTSVDIMVPGAGETARDTSPARRGHSWNPVPQLG